jgi:hypothetical protein
MDEEQKVSTWRTWAGIGLRFLWYLLLITLIFALWRGPEQGFRYLGL